MVLRPRKSSRYVGQFAEKSDAEAAAQSFMAANGYSKTHGKARKRWTD